MKSKKTQSLVSDGTSEDSEGKDSSFESNDSEDEKENTKTTKMINSLNSLKSKQQSYRLYMKVIKQKCAEYRKHSLWSVIYYIFFSNFNKKKYISLNEIKLRCKLLDKLELMDKEGKITKNEQKNWVIRPITNLNEYINYFSEKNFSQKPKDSIFADKINLLRKERSQETNLLKNVLSKKDNKEGKFRAEKGNQNFFQLYGIKEPLDVINKVIKDEMKNNNGQEKIKNFDILFNNKKIYEQEIENYKKRKNDIECEEMIFNEFLDFKSYKSFFKENDSIDLISKYGNKMEEQENFGIHLNDFIENIIQKIDPMQKLDEFNI